MLGPHITNEWLNELVTQRWFLHKELITDSPGSNKSFRFHFVEESGFDFNWVIFSIPSKAETSYQFPIHNDQIAFDHSEYLRWLVERFNLESTPKRKHLGSTHPCFSNDQVFIKFFPEKCDLKNREIQQNLYLKQTGLAPPILKSILNTDENKVVAIAWQKVEGPSLWDHLVQNPDKIAALWPECIKHLVKLHTFLPKLETHLSFEPSHPLFKGLSLNWQESIAHGDYHFGQILYTKQGLQSVDWEGEPLANPHWPSASHNLFSDLAGLFRSLDYFNQKHQLNLDLQSLWNSAWEMYFRCLNRKPNKQDCLQMAWAVLARNLYEIDYEKKSRPEMVEIPLKGLVESEKFAQSLLLP